MEAIRADIAVIGGGLGGCAAALAGSEAGWRVVVTEDTKWIGGQLTSEAVPPDEHPWIERFGAAPGYRALRNGIRAYYRKYLPLNARARRIRALNPGNGIVSRLCHDPRIAVAVLEQMFARYVVGGRARVMMRCRAVEANVARNRIEAVAVEDLRSGEKHWIEAEFFVDATPLGDLIELAGAEHVVGAESSKETGEPHAASEADPLDQQATTFCFAIECLPGEDHTIEEPGDYQFWRSYCPPNWPGPLFSWTVVRPDTLRAVTRGLFEAADGYSWWVYRRILDRGNFQESFAKSDVTVVDWPQNDYRLSPLCGVSASEQRQSIEAARQLSLSFLYWLQTEAPRPDGGTGYPELHIRSDVVGGTADGLALAPYIRSSRRLRTEFTVREQHIAYPLRPNGPELFTDSVGVGCYRIDLHPRTNGAGYLDLGCWPFQIPLGALIPVRMENLLPGGKNLGTTHITNGAFRVHNVEWSIGEAVGLLASFCLEHKVQPSAVRARPALLNDFQNVLRRRGVELVWPSLSPV